MNQSKKLTRIQKNEIIKELASECKTVTRIGVNYVKLLDDKYYMITRNSTNNDKIEEYLKHKLKDKGCTISDFTQAKTPTRFINDFKNWYLHTGESIDDMGLSNIIPAANGIYDVKTKLLRKQTDDDYVFFRYKSNYKSKAEMKELKAKPIIKKIERYINNICDNDKATKIMLWQAIRHSLIGREVLEIDDDCDNMTYVMSGYNNVYWIYNNEENPKQSSSRFIYDLICNMKSSDDKTYINVDIETIPKFDDILYSRRQVIENNIPIQESIIGYTDKTSLVPTLCVRAITNRHSPRNLTTPNRDTEVYLYNGSALQFTETSPMLQYVFNGCNPNFKYFKYIKLNNSTRLNKEMIEAINNDNDVRDYFFTKALTFNNKNLTVNDNHSTLMNEFKKASGWIK